MTITYFSKEEKERKVVLDCNKVFVDLASPDCLSDSSGTVLCLILNELCKEGKFSLEKEVSPWRYIKLLGSYRLFRLKVLSENWNFLLRKKTAKTLVRCLFFLAWKSKRAVAWEACRDGVGCVSAPAPQASLSHSGHSWLWHRSKVGQNVGEERLDCSLNSWMAQSWRNKLIRVLTACWSVFSDRALACKVFKFQKGFSFLLLFCFVLPLYFKFLLCCFQFSREGGFYFSVVKPKKYEITWMKDLKLEEKSSTSCKPLALKSLTKTTLRNIYVMKDQVHPSTT